MEKYGLIGRDISYSFSRSYFIKKFASEGIAATYQNFDLQEISDFFKVKNIPHLKGLNVTIPYKESIIPFLDDLDEHALKIGAVNTIKFEEGGKLTGYNTDFIGFQGALEPLLLPQHKKALILGTGGASKAVAYTLEQLKIPYVFVSRKAIPGFFHYENLDEKVLLEHQIIINCTPLGTFPKTEEFPPIPANFLTKHHFVFDLIYNPPTTKLMQLAEAKGARTSNGLQMLKIQAEEAWSIWNIPK